MQSLYVTDAVCPNKRGRGVGEVPEEAVHALHLVLITSVRDLTVIVNEHRGIKQYLPGSQPGKSAVTIRNFR